MDPVEAGMSIKLAIEHLRSIRESYRGLDSQEQLSLNYALTVLIKDVAPAIIKAVKDGGH